MPPERKSRVEREREQREATFIEDSTAKLIDAGTAVVDGNPGNVVAKVLGVAADVLADRGELHAEIRRAGWQSARSDCESAASLVRMLATMVEAYVPPADVPEVAPMVPPAPVATPGSDVALRDRLADAFGPELDTPTYSEIRTRVESEVDGTPPACTMGPACPVHPGIQVLHPPDAPPDAMAGPEGGTERLPDETAQDKTVMERIVQTAEFPPERFTPPDTIAFRMQVTQPVAVTPSGVVEIGEMAMTVGPAMPTMSDAGRVAGGRPRLSWPELYARRASHGPAGHRSVSQIEAAQDCGVKLALYREPEDRPAWWFVAGTALHTCIEAYEHALTSGADPIAEGHPWLPTFYTEIERVREATGVPTDRWRAARGSAEGYDWWRVEGEAMLARYIEWSNARHAAGWHILTVNRPRSTGHGDTMPVIEWPFRLDVNGIAVDGFIDQAWEKLTPGGYPNQIEIIDLKFGSSRPASRFQLGVYAHALQRVMVTAGAPDIGGAYYLGRKGETHLGTDDLRAAVPWETVVHQTLVTDAMDRAGLYLPRVSSFCTACGVRDLCPVGAQ